MNDQPAAPLRIDLRLVLEGTADSLAFVLAGVAAVHIGGPWDVLLALIVGGALVFIRRVIGRSSGVEINELRVSINRLVASNEVLKADATPKVIDAAAAAATAAAVPPKDAGKSPAAPAGEPGTSP